jgi:leader peptidase (prepilin peptidase)/N-methyltransferase
LSPHGLFLAIFTVLGLSVGSFLNVCSDRLPAGRSIINPPSACDACHKRLGFRDLVPLFSYLWLRGRCRYCRAAIPWHLPAVEAAMGIVFPLLYWYYGLNLELGFSLVYACLLTLILLIDIEHQLILDKVVYPGMVLALAFSPFQPPLGAEAGSRVISAVAGGAAGLVVMLLFFLLARGGLGLGDVKMAALMGLITGFPRVFVALFLAVIAGGLVAVALLSLGLKKRRQPIPFGPFLSIGTMAVVIWGDNIMGWYQQFIA